MGVLYDVDYMGLYGLFGLDYYFRTISIYSTDEDYMWIVVELWD